MSVRSSSNSSLHLPLECHNCEACNSISTVFFFITIPFLPLFVFVLYVGYQRWRKRRSVATTAMTSHSDVFTFNMAVLEIIALFGLFLYLYGAYTNRPGELIVGMYVYYTISPGQTLFHLLTCVERYLAVVHPVTYLRLRQTGGVRIRNISVGCVWLFCFVSSGLSNISFLFKGIYTSLLLVFSCAVMSFCSLSVLRVLTRRRPGEVGGNRERVNQSKQRAFHTIVTIMGALLLRFLSSLVAVVIYSSAVLSSSDVCLVMLSVFWFSLPSSLVLPLLLLQRAGKLPGCAAST